MYIFLHIFDNLHFVMSIVSYTKCLISSYFRMCRVLCYIDCFRDYCALQNLPQNQAATLYDLDIFKLYSLFKTYDIISSVL